MIMKNLIIILILILQSSLCLAGHKLEHLKRSIVTLEDIPTCELSRQRQKIRDKKLRESLHAHELTDISSVILSSKIFLSRFFDFDLYSSESIEVYNLWKINEAFINAFEKDPEALFVRMIGLGFEWSERITRFPKELQFQIDKEKQTLTTIHPAFYADYCGKIKAPEIVWSTSRENYDSTEELLRFLNLKGEQDG